MQSDSANLQMFVDLNREGNSAFFGNMTTRLFNEQGDTVAVDESFIQIYFDMLKKIDFPLADLTDGKYRVEIEVSFNEKGDIPESRLIPDKYTYKKELEFNYPIQK